MTYFSGQIGSLSSMGTIDPLKQAIRRIEIARRYTLDLVDDIDDQDWYRLVGDGVTHVAWQMGHLAVSQFSLALLRVRGKKPGDEKFISEDFRLNFGKGSIPQPAGPDQPAVTEIREIAAQVHHQVVQQAERFSEELLAEVLKVPHPMFSTKLGALQFCSAHELIHAGQIALIRRLLGKKPLR